MTEEQIKVAAFDIDGTLFRWSFLIDIVERLVELEKISPEAYESAEMLKGKWYRREEPYTKYLKEIIDIVEGPAMKTVARQDLVTVAEQVVKEKGRNVYVFTRELLQVVKDQGYRTVAISGSVKEAVQLFADIWGIDDVLATTLECDERGFFAGEVKDIPVHDKAKALKEYLSTLGRPAQVTIAVGDTMSDLSMLRMAECAIAFNPENALKAHARANGLPCVTERKNTITVLSIPGDANKKRVPRLFSETAVANILPRDVGYALKARLGLAGCETL